MDHLWIYQLFGLILTAPIHCRRSIGEQNFSKTVLMKKQTHLYFGWPEDVHICSKFWVSYSFKNRHFKSLVAIVKTLFIKGSQEGGSGVQLLWKPRRKSAGSSIVVIGSISMCGSVCMCTCLYEGYNM